MRIILAGIIGRYPWGGVTWCSLMYLLGLRELGHDVYYLEDTCESNYDPIINSLAKNPAYALDYIDRSLRPFGFGERWHYVDFMGKGYGMSAAKWREVCETADLLLVLSGGCWIWRDSYLRIPMKAFIDSDPAFTQIAIDRSAQSSGEDEQKQSYADFFRTYDRLFTFGRNIGTPKCTVPTAGFTWQHTWQPVSVGMWDTTNRTLPHRDVWTTVMTWKIESFIEIGGNKDQEFQKVLDLPAGSRQRGGPQIELAVNGPIEFLRDHGWRCVEAYPVSADLWRYHSYICSSRGEFSVAKHTYVDTNSGWFSDRSACYLAAGRPAVVQETGFGETLPTGAGLLSWRSADEAVEGLVRVEAEYEKHCEAARSLARAHFGSDVVLHELLDQC